MKNKPPYSIDSVDHALRLAVLLRQEGPVGVTDAAARLGVARSTAHRLLAMLVYRDFAEQDADRRYVAGPVLRSTTRVEPVAHLRAVALPHLRALMERTGETANLMVLVGDQVRFVATIECEHVLRVGDREGKMLPAHLASGGRALLARMSPEEIDVRYPENETQVDRALLHKSLRQARRQGYSINNQDTEAGVTAIGHAVDGADGAPMAALSVALPTARYARARLPDHVAALRDAARAIARETGDDWSSDVGAGDVRNRGESRTQRRA
ncbi:MAG: IclR family transcriptional regulator [Actinomycetota bacterium]|nr:IclR family transcriptional regulator [Actinomycetota bacterium]